MKLSKFDDKPAIYVLWQSNSPKAGDHLTVYETEEPIPGKQPITRMILDKCLHAQQHQVNKNFTEEWWSYHEVTEKEFYRIRKSVRQNERMADSHDTLF
jgi:hypothetical protein